MKPVRPAMQTQAEANSNVELVLQAKAGDADAFGQLVRLHQRRAVSLAYRLLGNSSDAADVAQDAFVRAYRSLGQLDDPARFSAWFMRIVSNLALNFRRARALRMAAPLEDGQLGEGALSSSGLRLVTDEPAVRGLPQEAHDAVSAALEKLPDKQRLALILFSVEGLPQKEVAEILECSVELVKWNVFQARQKLREMLQDHLGTA